MLLIITCSQDVITDMLLPFLDGIDIFRFDINKWNEYAWDFSSDGFVVQAPDGKQMRESDLRCVYLRKPMFLDSIDVPADGCLENWTRAEVERMWRDLYFDMCARGKAVFAPDSRGKWYKFSQMRLAKKYFKVPEFHIVRGFIPDEIRDGEWVAKALTQERIGRDKLFMTRKIAADKIDPYYPWFLQRRVDAQKEITAFYLNGKTFAFEIDRSKIKHDDSRAEGIYMKWERTSLSADEEAAIAKFMRDSGYVHGRFDFLRKDGELVFLELNHNGMWAWLDLKYEEGIFKYVADEIRKFYAKC